MDARRLAYRIAIAVQWIVFLVWGLAIWRDWDGTPFFWLAFGMAMFVAQYLRYQVRKTGGQSSDQAGRP